MTINTGLVIAVGGFAVPLLNALVTRVGAGSILKTAVSVVLAGTVAAVAWAADIGQVHDVKNLVFIALGAGLAAGGFKKAWLDDVEGWLRTVTGGFGIGAANPRKP